MFSFKKYMREKIQYLKSGMSCSAGQAKHLASPLLQANWHLIHAMTVKAHIILSHRYSIANYSGQVSNMLYSGNLSND